MCSFTGPVIGRREFGAQGLKLEHVAVSSDRPGAFEHVADKTAATANLLGDLLLTPNLAYAGGEPFPGLDGGHAPMTSTRGLPPSTKTTTGVDRGHSEDSEPMHEGEKLKQLLKVKRYEQVDLAKEAGVTKAAVGKWMTEKRFSDRVWPKVRDALQKLGLNPGDVRVGQQDQEASEDLTKLVERWPREQLTVIRRILTSDEVSKSRLIAYIDGALRPYT
jgi:transcriptional regulator with XRE-family HTH domain